MASWTMYVQSPEDFDEQGLYLKAEGEAKPWQTETDAEEFDGFHDPSKAGWSIRDVSSANRWLKENRFNGEVVKLEWL